VICRTARVLLVALLAPTACSLLIEGDAFRNQDGPSDAAPGARVDAGSVQPGSDADPGPDPRIDAAPSQPDAAPPDAAPPDAAPECSDSCGMCGGGCCTQTCGGGPDCRPTCGQDGCACTLDCAATEGTCEPRCERDSACAIDCSDVNDCRPRCRRGMCEIDCTGANNCDKVQCTEGASCLLDCAGSNNCEFERCDGEQVSCGGGVVACNRDCP
jgi:hypothetical protein